MKKTIILIISVITISCNTDPQPINYGTDSCDFCEMTIVNEAFSARAVNTKGKQFHYDAIECMVNDLQQKQIETSVLQVADYTDPGKMINVENAFFIINDSINSPMGANLAAVEKDNIIKESIDWNSLWNKFLKKGSSVHNLEK